MTPFDELSEPTELDALVGFFDLTGYMRFAGKSEPLELLALMSGYFGLCRHILEDAGGWFVKAIGDAGLAAFPADRTDAGVRAFLRLKQEGDDWLAARGIRSVAVVKLHVGPVACGDVAGRRDIYGHTVNLAAVMASGGFAVSPQVFRRLDGATRRLFKKHTPPVTYISAAAMHRAEPAAGRTGMM